VVLLAVPDRPAAAQRRWLPGSLEERGRVEDTDGRLMLNPQKVIACAGTIVVLDVAGPAVVAFDAEGRFAWRYDRSGEGPRELRQPIDIACANPAAIVVLDRANGKLLHLDLAGRFVREDRHTVDIHRVTGLEQRRFAFGTPTAALLRVGTTPDSATVTAGPAWLPGDALRRELQLASASPTTTAIGFRWTHRLLLHRGSGDLVEVQGTPEPIDVPELRTMTARGGTVTVTRIAPNAVEAVRSVTTHRDSVFALFVGRSGDSARVVDVYSARQARYLGSLRLPVAPLSIAATRGGLVGLVADPVPALVIWRRR